MNYTIGEAAKVTGKSKATISKAIKEGRISAKRRGNKPTSPMEIDAAELNRVFPVNTQLNAAEQVENATNTKALEVEVDMLRQMLDREKELNTDLQKRLDQTLALLPKPENPQGFLKRLFG